MNTFTGGFGLRGLGSGLDLSSSLTRTKDTYEIVILVDLKEARKKFCRTFLFYVVNS